MKPAGLVTIAVDAGDRELIQKWASDGYLPTLAKLLGQGVIARVSTPPAVVEGAVWPTLVTSWSPGSHGMSSYLQIRPGTYEVELGCRADRLPTLPFWAYLSQAGKRVAIVDAPLTRPVKGLNGLQVVNWGAHDAFWSWKRSSWPPRLIHDLVARFGEHPVKVCDAEHRRTLAEYAELRARLIDGVRLKTRLLKHCLELDAWDFFFGAFSESHCAGHQFWHLMDPGHPLHDSATPPALESAMRDVYAAIDAGIGEILAGLSPATHVLVVLSHGMGPYYAGSHLLDQVLDRLHGSAGCEVDEERIAAVDSRRLRRQTWGLTRLFPAPVRRALKLGIPNGLLTVAWQWAHPPLPDPHWIGMRAFSIPSNNMTGAIRINLKGREPDGLVKPGAEYEALCRQLTEALLELEDPETGRRMVQWVARREELYTGPRADALPDLFVEWDHSAPITGLRSPRIGTVSAAFEETRTGDHLAGGLLIGAGPTFAGGAVEDELRTLDLAPTILDFFGVGAPATFEGKSVLPLLGKGGVSATEVTAR